MRTLAELQTIRERVRSQVSLRAEDHSHIRVVVGMAIRGIAVDTRLVLSTLARKVQPRGPTNRVPVTQMGYIGLCQYGPIVGVIGLGKEEVTYVRMNPDKALEVMGRHLIDGHPVEKCTMGVAGLK